MRFQSELTAEIFKDWWIKSYIGVNMYSIYPRDDIIYDLEPDEERYKDIDDDILDALPDDLPLFYLGSQKINHHILPSYLIHIIQGHPDGILLYNSNDMPTRYPKFDTDDGSYLVVLSQAEMDKSLSRFYRYEDYRENYDIRLLLGVLHVGCDEDAFLDIVANRGFKVLTLNIYQDWSDYDLDDFQREQMDSYTTKYYPYYILYQGHTISWEDVHDNQLDWHTLVCQIPRSDTRKVAVELYAGGTSMTLYELGFVTRDTAEDNRITLIETVSQDNEMRVVFRQT